MLTGARVAVVDDDPLVLDSVGGLLGDEGFTVATAGTVDAIEPLLRSFQPDLVVLDLRMPGSAGHGTLRMVRALSDRPVVVLTALDDEPDRILALELGADDVVTKPFSERELVARVRIRLRRPPGRTAAPASDDGDGVRVDLAAHQASVDGRPIELTTKEFELLDHFVRHPRRAFTRDDLLDAVWHSSATWQSPATVTEHVHRLRQKVGAGRIATVRGVGYRFEPDG